MTESTMMSAKKRWPLPRRTDSLSQAKPEVIENGRLIVYGNKIYTKLALLISIIAMIGSFPVIMLSILSISQLIRYSLKFKSEGFVVFLVFSIFLTPISVGLIIFLFHSIMTRLVNRGFVPPYATFSNLRFKKGDTFCIKYYHNVKETGAVTRKGTVQTRLVCLSNKLRFSRLASGYSKTTTDDISKIIWESETKIFDVCFGNNDTLFEQEFQIPAAFPETGTVAHGSDTKLQSVSWFVQVREDIGKKYLYTYEFLITVEK